MITQGINLVQAAATSAFWENYLSPNNLISRVAYRLNANDKTVPIAFLGAPPNLHKWVGDRIHKGTTEQTFTLTNELYETTIDIDYFTWSSSAGASQAKVLAAKAGAKAANYPWSSTIVGLLNNGASSGYTAYDGVIFFATTHKDKGTGYQTNQANAATVTSLSSTTAPTGYDLLQCVRKAQSMIIGMLDSEGDPQFPNGYNDYQLIVVAHPTYSASLEQVRLNESVISGSSPVPNELVGRFEAYYPVGLTAVATTPAIYCMAISNASMPFIYNEHTPMNLTDNADRVLSGEVPVYTITGSTAFGMTYGDWRSCMKITLST